MQILSKPGEDGQLHVLVAVVLICSVLEALHFLSWLLSIRGLWALVDVGIGH